MAAAAEAASAAAGRSRVRPTGRGIAVLLVAVLLWVGGEITGLTAGRMIGIALILAALLSLVGVLVLRVGLGLSRRVLDDAVTAGAAVRVDLRLLPGALAARIPLGHGTVTLDLPAALGGAGDLDLAPRMPHHLEVRGRGVFDLGPCVVRLRDPFGLLLLRARVELPGRVVGLPIIEQIGEAGSRRLGIGRHDDASGGAVGSGELGVIPRAYAPGDDMRRIHWRASARAGRLMTREEEPPRSEGAVIVMDTRRPADAEGADVPSAARDAVQDRLLDHAASLLVSLAAHGWETRVVDSEGDEITRMPGRSDGGASPLGAEAGAISVRSALIDLAGVGFGDDDATVPAGPASMDHAAGHIDLAIALGPDHGEPFADLELDRFAGRASRRTAIAVRPAAPGADTDAAAAAAADTDAGAAADSAPDAGPGSVRVAHDGTWLRLDVPADATLQDILSAGSAAERSLA